MKPSSFPPRARHLIADAQWHIARAIVIAALASVSAHAQTASTDTAAPDLDPAVETVASAGTWTTGSAHGRYRVLVVTEGWEEVRHRAFVQWVEESHWQDEPEVVRASRDLTEVAKIYGLVEPTFTRRAGRWYVALRGATRPLAQYTRRLTFELGPPGKVRVSSRSSR